MKKEQLYEAIGDVDEIYVDGARNFQKKSTRAVWLKWGGVAACLCLAIVVIFNLIPAVGPEDVEGPYSYTVAYVGWSNDQTIYDNAINSELLKSEPGYHLPIFRMDTLEDLEQFKVRYENIFAMDQGYEDARSFEDVLKQAQWDREIFYEEHSMLIIYIPANTGSLRFYVGEIITKDSSLCFSVEQKNDSDVMTDDMAGWMLFVGVDKEEIQKYTFIDAFLSNSN
jgi:hypothetical protein